MGENATTVSAVSPKRVFLTGGTGLIGRAVVSALRGRGDRPVVLTRDTGRAAGRLGQDLELVEGDPAVGGAWEAQLAGADAVVNLAGEPIFGGRWTKKRKERIRASRVEGTRRLARAAAAGGARVMVSASAVGYYGPRGDEELTEDAAPGTDFLARLSVAWEDAAGIAGENGCRVVTPRTGVVLAAGAGALAEMTRPFRLHLGGPIGSGRQWVSWVHVDDLVALILAAIDREELSGPINATAPAPVTNAELARTIGAAMGRRSWLPAPAFMLRLVLGEVADVITKGQRVVPAKALAAGFAFRYPRIADALSDLLGGAR